MSSQLMQNAVAFPSTLKVVIGLLLPLISCLVTEVIIVADSEEVNRFSEQFVCEIFHNLGGLGRRLPQDFFKIKTPPSLTGFFMWGEWTSPKAAF